MKIRKNRQPGRARTTQRISRYSAIAVICSALASTITVAQANDRHVATERFTEYGKVISVQPVYREVRLSEPREECWTEQQQVTRYDSTHQQRYQGRNRAQHASSGALVGSLIGGVIGNQLGRGHGSGSRAGATVAGAIIGGAIGNEARADSTRHRRHRPERPVIESRPVERCKRVVESRYEQRLQHYNVTYRYKGRTYTTQLPRDPGDRIELQVSVRPARR